MSSDTGVIAYRTARVNIEISQKEEVFWQNMSMRGEQSVVGVIQI